MDMMLGVREAGFGLDAWEEEGGSAPRPRSPQAAPPGEAPHTGVPRFFNDMGVASIGVGVEALNCIGAMPPADHPHVYLDMTDRADIACPYCSTRFFRDPSLRANETAPPGCFYDSGAGAPRRERRDGGIP